MRRKDFWRHLDELAIKRAKKHGCVDPEPEDYVPDWLWNGFYIITTAAIITLILYIVKPH